MFVCFSLLVRCFFVGCSLKIKNQSHFHFGYHHGAKPRKAWFLITPHNTTQQKKSIQLQSRNITNETNEYNGLLQHFQVRKAINISNYACLPVKSCSQSTTLFDNTKLQKSIQHGHQDLELQRIQLPRYPFFLPLSYADRSFL